jgi:hypothetical protein
VTIARTPLLLEAGCDEEASELRECKAEYFLREDWTTQISLNEHANFDFWRSRI